MGLYLPSPYAIPYGSFQQPVLPPTVGPHDGPLVYVGLNCAWIPYIAGALNQLQLQSTWIVASTDELLKVQGQATDLIALFNCASLPSLQDLIGTLGNGDCEDCMCCLRVQNGVLQQLVCGVWTDVPGQGTGGLNPPPQPGNGSPQPPRAGCATYHGVVDGGKLWNLPTVVSTGDTIEIVSAIGASNQSPGIPWYCVDGNIFLAGSCLPNSAATSGTDLLPTAPHGALIAVIGTTYYNIQPGPFTVPAGISSAQVQLLINHDAAGEAVNGSFTIDVKVCNNQSGNFTLTYTQGTGPTSVMPGSTILCSSAFTGASDHISFDITPACKLTVVDSSGYIWSGINPTLAAAAWTDPTGGSHSIAGGGPGAFNPTSFPAATPLTFWALDDDQPVAGHPFSVNLLIESL